MQIKKKKKNPKYKKPQPQNPKILWLNHAWSRVGFGSVSCWNQAGKSTNLGTSRWIHKFGHIQVNPQIQAHPSWEFPFPAPVPSLPHPLRPRAANSLNFCSQPSSPQPFVICRPQPQIFLFPHTWNFPLGRGGGAGVVPEVPPLPGFGRACTFAGENSALWPRNPFLLSLKPIPLTPKSPSFYP